MIATRTRTTLIAVAVCATTTVVAPTAASAAPPGACTTLTAGEVTWGYKKSTIDYVSGNDTGGVEAFDGARYDKATKTFTFPVDVAASTVTNNSVTLHLKGGFRLTAYKQDDGRFLMDQKFTNIVADFHGTTGELTTTFEGGVTDDDHSMFDPLHVVRDGITVADMKTASPVTASTAREVTASTFVATSGEFLFQGFYTAGTELTPLSVHLECAPAAGDATTPGETPAAGDATTPGDTPQSTNDHDGSTDNSASLSSAVGGDEADNDSQAAGSSKAFREHFDGVYDNVLKGLLSVGLLAAVLSVLGIIGQHVAVVALNRA